MAASRAVWGRCKPATVSCSSVAQTVAISRLPKVQTHQLCRLCQGRVGEIVRQEACSAFKMVELLVRQQRGADGGAHKFLGGRRRGGIEVESRECRAVGLGHFAQMLIRASWPCSCMCSQRSAKFARTQEPYGPAAVQLALGQVCTDAGKFAAVEPNTRPLVSRSSVASAWPVVHRRRQETYGLATVTRSCLPPRRTRLGKSGPADDAVCTVCEIAGQSSAPSVRSPTPLASACGTRLDNAIAACRP
jgi:hypothetical protein